MAHLNREPGQWVTAQAVRHERIIWAGLALFALVCGGVLVLAATQRIGIAASVIFLLAVLAVRPYAQRFVDDHLRWHRGAHAERSVGEALNLLREEGWTVLHDDERLGSGNVDHIVCGPGGAFLVETKERRYEDQHLTKAKRQAARLHDLVGVWVTPVICLHKRTSQPFRSQGVWVVPHQHLVEWLRNQRGTPVDPHRLAALRNLVD